MTAIDPDSSAASLNAIPPCWYIEFENHGRITVNESEVALAFSDGAIRVTAYSQTAPVTVLDTGLIERTRIIRRLREIAKEYEHFSPANQQLALERVDQIEIELAERNTPMIQLDHILLGLRDIADYETSCEEDRRVFLALAAQLRDEGPAAICGEGYRRETLMAPIAALNVTFDVAGLHPFQETPDKAERETEKMK